MRSLVRRDLPVSVRLALSDRERGSAARHRSGERSLAAPHRRFPMVNALACPGSRWREPVDLHRPISRRTMGGAGVPLREEVRLERSKAKVAQLLADAKEDLLVLFSSRFYADGAAIHQAVRTGVNRVERVNREISG